jgi:putative endonuclease
MARWSVYIVRCRDGSLYTGIATDVRRRIAEHARDRGRGAKFLRGRGPLLLVFQRAIGTRGLALRVESAIKKVPKARKEELITRRIVVDRMIELARDQEPARVLRTGSLARRAVAL